MTVDFEGRWPLCFLAKLEPEWKELGQNDRSREGLSIYRWTVVFAKPWAIYNVAQAYAMACRHRLIVIRINYCTSHFQLLGGVQPSDIKLENRRVEIKESQELSERGLHIQDIYGV